MIFLKNQAEKNTIVLQTQLQKFPIVCGVITSQNFTQHQKKQKIKQILQEILCTMARLARSSYLCFFFFQMGLKEEKKETCGTICLKYLLFSFNFLFWVGICYCRLMQRNAVQCN